MFGVASVAVVAHGNPAARGWIGEAVPTHWRHVAPSHPALAPTVMAVDTEEAPRPTGRDARFADRPAAQVGGRLGSVQIDGFIGLPQLVAGPEASFERAVLSTEPSSPTAAASEPAPSPALDAAFAGAHDAIALYRKGALAQGDEFSKAISDPLLQTTLEWVALRYNPRDAGLSRLRAFVTAHPDWPMLAWINRRIEEVALGQDGRPAGVKARFEDSAPQTFVGRVALARADLALGEPVAAATIVRDIWQTGDFDSNEEGTLLKEFGGLLRRDDFKLRADRLLYKEQVAPALRSAALAGSDVKLLAAARASVIAQGAEAAMNAAIAAVPKTLVNDPGLVFARVQRARRAGQIGEAAELLANVTRDPALLIDGDAWWVERRLVARKLLDLGEATAAYEVCAKHAATSDTSNIEAEFHAGWIALRFLDAPKDAADHFRKAAGFAATPISRARVAYWQGRAADAGGDKDAAARFYAEAANQPISFYGQLAASKLGRTSIDLRQPAQVVTGPDRHEGIRVVEQLYRLGERDIALSLALEIAKTEPSDAQVAALAGVLTRGNDARGTLLIGKLGTQRGLPVDEAAFPTFGIPGYQPLTNSADRAVVYAIARQESEFNPQSVSSAGAKGLMQMIGPTARATANKFGVSYDDARLLSDASFNAQLGAAHLGQLLNEQGGSYILTFAAYNAGSARVREWIAAYGDPRKPGVDPVDWIERIPFTETRNYVQRVFENLQIYRLRFDQSSTLLAVADLVPRGKGT